MTIDSQYDFLNEDLISEDHDFFDSPVAWWDSFGEYIRQFSENDRASIKTLSLFSGAGGLDIGFHDAGFDIIEAVELDPKLAASLEANIGNGKYLGPDTNVIVGDICEYDPKVTDIEFIIGGPPCQSFSAAGARASGVAGTKDSRGNLFQEYVRILNKLKPAGFLFENVYRILGANNGKDWEEIRSAFSNVGYDLTFRVLDTADYGVPQNRERLIIVGVANGRTRELAFNFPRPTHGPDSRIKRKYSSASQALIGVTERPDKNSLTGKYGPLLNDIPPGLNYSFFTEKMGHPTPIFSWRSKFSDFLYKSNPDEPVRTIKAQGGQYTGPFHWDSRPFSKQEFKRLQTFPDRYDMIGSKATVIKQIGNSVPPQFARMLALSIKEQIFKRNSPFEIDTIDTDFVLSFRKHKSARTAKYRDSAKRAIEMLSPLSPTSDALPKTVTYDLGDNFNLSTMPTDKYKCTIIKKSARLTFNTAQAPVNENAKIIITPINQWPLPFESVTLIFNPKHWQSYTSAWKIFDLYLSKNSYKADLEQLNGYYQYESKLDCRLVSKASTMFSSMDTRLLKLIIAGKLTQRKMSANEISEISNLNESNVLDQLKQLKKIGYAIRNSNTNVAMDENIFLIPYSFPTLNPLSVQLNKEI